MRLILSATAVIVALSASPSLARVRDYPWCARTPTNDFSGGCDFDTWQQCQATISGQGGTCQVNPILAFGQQNRTEQQQNRMERPARRRVHQGY